MKKLAVLLALTCALSGATQAMAKDISFSSPLTQKQFRDLTREAGAAISYKNIAPAEPLGISGFDVGAELSAIDISNSSYWNAAYRGDSPSFLVIPKLRARKGLPMGIDVGAMYSYVPDSNIKLWGIEVSKAILEGTAATPALGVRATYSRLSGVNDLDLQTAGIDASISKGLLIMTPYAGVGGVWVNSEAKGRLKALAPGLDTEDVFQPRVFGGIKFSPLPLLGVTAEVEYQERLIYSLKAGLSF
ncbi:hypothetical protein M1B72_02170 [Geomonas paludis]|uniref:Outer membrane protein beta-barrel domain-containing protein n=1 Tax=Geomonas paludis TaxID=2740185 RepID=A0A6V8N0A5_9BACT|nr:hypothetical protein [Geomonas paludis]UPU36531.1 hypothetical protein M1B72_02170 [Geomonas paludis]GFO65287.1 hypothetical protein GMPD_32060 [Geomonas paludis]